MVASPNRSLPTLAIITTSAPHSRAATAWFAPLPPNPRSNRVPKIVSPGRGNVSLNVVKSVLALPMTAMWGDPGIFFPQKMAPRTYNTPAEWASAYMETTSDRRAIANSTGRDCNEFPRNSTIGENGRHNRRIRTTSLKHAQRALTSGTYTMKSKHLVALAALFLFAAVARADDVQGPVTDTSLIGKLHTPGESISYNFFVESFEINGYGEAILNGTFTDRGAGLRPSTTTFSAD